MALHMHVTFLITLLSPLFQVLQYVEDVLAERVTPNNAAGRQLLELVNSLPNLAADTFAAAFASSVKDLLMVRACCLLSAHSYYNLRVYGLFLFERITTATY